MFRTIAVVLQDAGGARNLLDHVIPLAREWDALLVGIHAEPLPVDYSSGLGFPDVGLIQAASEAAEERTQQVEALFAARTAEAGLEHRWHSLRTLSGSHPLDGIAAARCADIVIVGQRDPAEGGADHEDLDAVLYESGRPVLVLPYSGGELTRFRKVMICWNGSREATRAAFDALPLISAAESTEILLVDPEDDSGEADGGTALASALSRHGASVFVSTTKSGGRGVDHVICDRVKDTGVDLLVIGAYSHSWLRELLFGGVTRSVLHTLPVATLMSR
jgi:nucleotide-binding universal stress UspA family protein